MHHRIFHPEPLDIGAEISVTGDELHHAVRVVRLREGEPVEIFDGRGHCVEGRVAATTRDLLRVAIERVIPSRESKTAIHLAMAVINLEKFELILQKATELGAASITPLETERVEIRAERYRGKVERWEKIIFEAVKQSGRSIVPPLAPPATLDEVLAKGGRKILFDADEEPSEGTGTSADLTILIGPEGGWAPEEIAQARAGGCAFRRLGSRRLRAETAAIMAVGIIAAQHGDI